jgi:hypothetical protein
LLTCTGNAPGRSGRASGSRFCLASEPPSWWLFAMNRTGSPPPSRALRRSLLRRPHVGWPCRHAPPHYALYSPSPADAAGRARSARRRRPLGAAHRTQCRHGRKPRRRSPADAAVRRFLERFGGGTPC